MDAAKEKSESSKAWSYGIVFPHISSMRLAIDLFDAIRATDGHGTFEKSRK